MGDIEVIQDILKRLRDINPEPPPKYRYNLPKLLSYQKEWRLKNPKADKAIKDRYYTKPRAKALAIARKHNRRVKLKKTEGSFTVQEWESRKKEFDYHCAYCGKKTQNLTVDHYIPLSKGGNNSIDNIIPAGIKCNKEKFTKDPSQYKFTARTQIIMSRLHLT